MRFSVTLREHLFPFTCARCGFRGCTHRWFMTCPRCWVPMVPGTPETYRKDCK